MSKELDEAWTELRTAVWRERWLFVAIWVAMVLMIAITWGLAQIGHPEAVWLWGFLK